MATIYIQIGTFASAGLSSTNRIFQYEYLLRPYLTQNHILTQQGAESKAEGDNKVKHEIT